MAYAKSRDDLRFNHKAGVSIVVHHPGGPVEEILSFDDTPSNQTLKRFFLNRGVSIFDLVKVYGKHGALDLIGNYLHTARPEKSQEVHPRNGWTDNKSHFIAGSEAIPLSDSIRGCFTKQPAFHPPAGEVEDWQRCVASTIRNHAAYSWAVSLPFAACLLPFVDIPKNSMGGFHLFGPSSSGKTICLRICGTVFGDEYHTWDTTANALEILASDHNHSLLCLDELGQAKNNKVVLDSAYKFSQCQGKDRTDVNLSTPRPFTFSLMFLSTGEDSFENLIQMETGRAPYAGQKIRFCDIEFNDKITTPCTTQELVDFETALDSYSGAAGRAFIERLASTTPEEKKKIKDAFLSIRKDLWKNEENGKFRRVANRFALCILAGRLAREWGILPADWNESFGPTKIYNHWRESNGAIDEGKQVAKNLMDFISTARASGQLHHFNSSARDDDGKRLSSILTFEAKKNVHGFLCTETEKGEDAREVAYLLPRSFKEAIGVKAPTVAKRFLRTNGIIGYDEARKTYNVRMPVLKTIVQAESVTIATHKTVAIEIDLEKLKGFLDFESPKGQKEFDYE